MASSSKVPKIEKADEFSLSMQSMARLPMVPRTEKVDDGGSREIEFPSEPLPKGWEQCLAIKTGELFYICRSCGKRTKKDPRPILKGCRKCLSYIMIPREVKKCPSCNAFLFNV
ncbi:uncharacterized protein LOC131060106 [Cryptomeria japonica]|uniref:uncharacterized protein LOC131060106 n=1 Tax=Cryptomeria japonica TaxID=3369 RepID=UPI0027DA6E1B|nr:uncharacterized protein LOC131060106 [Cryptomeria japonica]